MKAVDIIIPIYNAFEYTEECIKSVLKYTDLSNNNLILINDKSSDNRIESMLDNYKNKYYEKNIIIISNNENMGFVKTVNIGMNNSKENDVLLLNSDTEVTSKWLEKIKECAYSNEYIATVTPFTNNGTIASIPNFGEDNKLPENISLDEYAEIVENCSNKEYPEVPTGNGFCLFIKRKAINEIGFFDEDTFEKGYGEENDFCYRALNHGYINVICDNTFIYHKGTQSFSNDDVSSEKKKLMENHIKIINKRYPFYSEKLNEYMASNIMRPIHEKIRMNIELYGKKRIAFFINEWDEKMEMTGGTSLHVKDIIEKLIPNNYACFVICPSYNEIHRMEVYLYTQKEARLLYSIKTDKYFYSNLRYSNQTYRRFLENLFNTFEFDIVHIHHLLFQTFDIYEIAKKYNSYIITSLHDLYTICPAINMVYDGKYCNGQNNNCEECINNKYNITENIITSWRENYYLNLKKSNLIIVPSEDTKKIINGFYEDLDIKVVEHGVKVIKTDIKNKREINNQDINIAFVGAMAVQKGSEILKSLIEKNSLHESNLKIHLFGKTFDKELENNRKNYIFHGKYSREQLPKLLNENNIDLICIFSIWPETYSYTLTEAYMAQIPILAFDIGAIGDRIRKDKLGWLIPVTKDIDFIINKINECLSNKEEYNKILENYKTYKFKEVSEMQEYYLNLYNSSTSIKNKPVKTEFMQKLQDEADLIDLRIIVNNQGNEIAILKNYIERNEFLVNRFNKIQNTKVWKIAKKIKGSLKKDEKS